MYTPYYGDIDYIQKITQQSGKTLRQMVIQFFKSIKNMQVPKLKTNTGNGKMNWNGS
jgi:hypothetical protein